MELSLPLRLGVCVISGAAAFLLAYSALHTEAFFWTFVCVVGVAAFLLPKPPISIKERIGLIGLWDLMAPVILVVFATISSPADIELNALRLMFLAVFFVGASTAARLLLTRPKS